ncbi:MAG: LysM peptidoglycan-binding domain-containing protein [Phascolarctobacterium sp.]|nr:LysM peptidoglycan-binding domain-containing protein [Phascolarctobacterium sp.]
MKRLLAIILLCMALYSGIDFFLDAGQEYTCQTVTVAKGDTLWRIAGLFAAGGEDVREVIWRICGANGLKGKNIRPGQVFRVPVRMARDCYILASK